MKVYKSNLRSYGFCVKVNGVRKRIHFEDLGDPYFYGVFRCFDNKLAEAIEKYPTFGKTFFLMEDDCAKKTESAEVEEPKFAAVYEDVKRTQEANKILVNEYGIEKSQLSSKEDALRIAKELNINFPNL